MNSYKYHNKIVSRTSKILSDGISPTVVPLSFSNLMKNKSFPTNCYDFYFTRKCMRENSCFLSCVDLK